MATNKECIENLEAGLGGLQDRFSRMEVGLADKLRLIEDNLKSLSDSIASSCEVSNSNQLSRPGTLQLVRERAPECEEGRPSIFPKLTKLEFPSFSGSDPTEWLNWVGQFFDFQATAASNRVALASFHLEGEANYWWQWQSKTNREEGRVVDWATFEEELWAKFGMTEFEECDEALLRIRQTSPLREYQQEFERLGNRVHSWTQKALVSTFIGGLKPELANRIRMFRPKTLKDAVGLARMREEQMDRQKRLN